MEYVCRILLRSDEYVETYESALSMSQETTRLRFLFRPLLPLPEPKFLRCEKESVKRWESKFLLILGWYDWSVPVLDLDQGLGIMTE